MKLRHIKKERLMVKCSITLVLGILLFGCIENDRVNIQVDFKNSNSVLEGKKVFLSDLYADQILDSAIVRDGKFQFSLKTDAGFSPFEARMCYALGEEQKPSDLLGYVNSYQKRTFASSFYADRVMMKCEADTSDFSNSVVPHLLILNPNKQTEAAYRLLTFSKSEEPRWKKYNSDLVGRFPNSIELLRRLDYQKSKMKDSALKELLALFDESVHKSAVYKQLEHYVNYQSNRGTSLPSDVTLFEPNGAKTSSILEKGKHNLVVFWASWCGPCRLEIPQIKSLYNLHKEKLNVVSISIDKHENAWQKAIVEEKMPWSQMLLKQDSSFMKFDKEFNLSAIPVWVLLDQEGRTIAKQVGYDEGEDAIDKRVISLLRK